MNNNEALFTDSRGQSFFLDNNYDAFSHGGGNGQINRDRAEALARERWDAYSAREELRGKETVLSDFISHGLNNPDEKYYYTGQAAPQAPQAPISEPENPFEAPLPAGFINTGENPDTGLVSPSAQQIGTNPFESPLYQGISNILNKDVNPNQYYGFNFQNAYANPLYGNGKTPSNGNPFGSF